MAYIGAKPVPVVIGGTGDTTLTAHGVLLGEGTSAISATATGSAGQVLLSGGSSADPSYVTPTSGTGLSVTTNATTLSYGLSITPLTQIDGNTSSVSGSTVTLTTGSSNANGTAAFAGNGTTTMTLNFSDSSSNTGLGHSVLSSASLSGGNNTCFGYQSGKILTSGASNVCIGSDAGLSLTSDSSHVLIGANAGETLAGASNNVIIGESAASLTTTGSNNVMAGYQSGSNILTGGNNTLVGYQTGFNYTSSESNNIQIGYNVEGTVGESNVLRIGTGTGSSAGQLNAAYISGISGVNVGSVASVVSISGNQLGSTTITAGSNISVTPGANTITIAASIPASFTWSVITSSQSAAAANGYICNSSSLITLTLPSTVAVGALIEVTGLGTGGWKIAQNSSQNINFGTSTTTTGTGGSLASTHQYDSLKMVCTVANTTFNVLSSIGNITVV